jgi:hypothetical protein
MILRRITEHVKAQNWFAVGIDFFIVVVGVFIGIQVSNWNESRADRARERVLLGELRAEVAETIRVVERRRNGFEQVARSGQRAIAFLDSGQECGDTCWPVIVDFFHASQWQSLQHGLTSYEELRRSGWPSNRAITEATDAYERNTRALATSTEAPAYRTLVRGLIPLAVHHPYWTSCYRADGVGESYVEDCPQAVAPAISASGVQAIKAHPDIHRTLTEWVGYTFLISASLGRQNEHARKVLTIVDAELAGENRGQSAVSR